MDVHGWIALALLAAVVVLFIRKVVPAEVVAVGIPIALVVLRLLPLESTASVKGALSGFGDKAVISIGAMFVVGSALQEAGVTTLTARAIQRIGGRSQALLVLGLMVLAMALSSIMSTVAAVTALLPAALALGRRTGTPPSRLLIPLSFGAVTGCFLFQISSIPNMIVHGKAAEVGLHLGMFAFTRHGAPIALAGLAFMALAGRRLLPSHSVDTRLSAARLPEEVATSYGLHGSLFRLTVMPTSSICGRSIADAGVRTDYQLDIVAVARPRTVGEDVLEPSPDLVLAAGDVLFVEGDDEAAWRLADYETLQFGLAGPAEVERILERGVVVAEVGLSPRSSASGRTLRDLHFRSRMGLNVLSLWRRGTAAPQGFADQPLEFGDVLLVSGPPTRLHEIARDPDWVVFTDVGAAEDVRRAPLAIAIVLLAILPAAFQLTELAVSALAAAGVAVATGCLSVTRAWQSVEWRVLLLVMGMLPLGEALKVHGVADVAAHALLAAGGHLGPGACYALLFLCASVVGTLTLNSAAAVILSPVALQLAGVAHLDVARALLAVSFGASCAFMLPLHPWNLVVMGPGGYEARDFLRAGLPMTLVVAVAAILSLSLG